MNESEHAPLRPTQLVSTMVNLLVWDTFSAISKLLARIGHNLREEQMLEEQVIVALLRIRRHGY